MNSKEIVRETLEFKIPDRIAVWDDLPEKTLKCWQKERQDFDFDITFEKEERNKFLVFRSSGPFGMAAEKKGLQKVLEDIARDPKQIESILKRNTDRIIENFENSKNNGFEFDGAWLWSDLAYKKGPLFSIDFYKKALFPLHRELCKFFDSLKLPVIYHSDGNIKEFIPFFIDAGFRSIHPLQVNCGCDVTELKKQYGKYIVFFGNISLKAFEDGRKEIESEITKKIEQLKENGGYIYSADGPISEAVSLETYTFALNLIKKQ